MPTVRTNEISYAFCVETAPGVPSTLWKDMPTSSNFNVNSTVNKERPNVISKTRQQLKEIPVSLNATAEGEVPATIASMQYFIEGLMHCRANNRDMYISSTGVNDTTTPGTFRYQVPAITASQAAKLASAGNATTERVFMARNFSNPINNGVKILTSPVVPISATELTFQVGASPYVTEATNVKRGAVLEYMGIRCVGAIGTKPVWTYNALTKTAVLDRNSAFNWSTAGFKKGQMIQIGIDNGSGVAIGGGNNTANDDSYGYARITDIVGNTLRLDKISSRLRRTVTFPTDVYISTGQMVLNLPIDDPDYLRETYQIQSTYPTLGAGNTPVYYYQKGCYPSSLNFSLTAAALGNITYNFLCLDRENSTTVLKSGAINSQLPTKDSSMSAAASVKRLRVTKLNEDVLSTLVTDIQFNIDNAMAQEDIIGQLNPYDISPAPISISATMKSLFTNPLVIDAVRNNETLSADFILNSPDGAVAIDLPEFTLKDDSVELEENKFVKLNFTSTSFPDSKFGSSAIITIFSSPLQDTEL
jgi:hypothetical protein